MELSPPLVEPAAAGTRLETMDYCDGAKLTTHKNYAEGVRDGREAERLRALVIGAAIGGFCAVVWVLIFGLATGCRP